MRCSLHNSHHSSHRNTRHSLQSDLELIEHFVEQMSGNSNYFDPEDYFLSSGQILDSRLPDLGLAENVVFAKEVSV